MKLVLALYVVLLVLLLSACGKPDKGDRGSDGAVGKQGPAGQDLVPVTVVKLCPGATTYPSVFVEVGLCINNKLWGVYSANGGFLTELSPGNYSSNAIGSACNLKILPNCVVEAL